MAIIAQHDAVFDILCRELGEYLGSDVPARDRQATPTLDLGGAARPDRDAPVSILGVIDDMIPFAHPALAIRGPDGPRRTRVVSAWAMGAASVAESTVPFGREWLASEIDALVARHPGPCGGVNEESLYRSAGVWDARRGPLHAGGRRDAHGAAVTTLLAGAGQARDADGHPCRDDLDVSPAQYPILGVALPPVVTAQTEGTFAPWFMMVAVRHLVDRAARLARALDLARPPLLTINLSYGVAAGAKDGGGLVESFQRAIAAAPSALGEIQFVLPMGNFRQDRLTARLDPGASVTLDLPPGSATTTFVEVWGPPGAADGPRAPDLLIAPPGAAPERLEVPLHTTRTLTLEGHETARAYASEHRSADGRLRRVLTLALAPTWTRAGGITAPPGAWRLAAPDPGPVLDVRVQRNEAVPGFGTGMRQARLRDDAYRKTDAAGRRVMDDATDSVVRRTGTINAYATAPQGQLRATATYSDGTSAPYCSVGRADMACDAVSAASDQRGVLRGISVAGAKAGVRTRAAGTSMAAPQVARAHATRRPQD